MKRKYHVRFLGGPRAATPGPYPASKHRSFRWAGTFDVAQVTKDLRGLKADIKDWQKAR
jgi:hypothetical protein